MNSIAREDLPRAERLAEIGTWLADLSDDFFGRARIRRSFGNLQVLRGKHAEALQTFDSCIEQFFLINAEVEVAATLFLRSLPARSPVLQIKPQRFDP